MLGYTGQGRGMQAVTYADIVKQLTDRVGVYRAQLGASLAQKLGSFGVEMPEATVAVEQYGITNDAQASAASSYLGMAQSYGYGTAGDARQMMSLSQMQSPFQSNLMGGIAQQLVAGGMSFPEAIAGVSGLGLSDHQASIAGRMAQGDLKAWSQYGRETGQLAYQFLTPDNRPLYMSSGTGFIQQLGGQLALGNMGVFGTAGAFQSNVQNAITAGVMGKSPLEQAQALFEGYGGDNTALMQGFAQMGGMGLELAHNQQMYDLQMAGVGVQLKGIALQENYLWGANEGGTWNNPAQGSMWDLQDRMTALQHRSTLADFSASRWRMDTQNEFADTPGRPQPAAHGGQPGLPALEQRLQLPGRPDPARLDA